MMLSLNVDNYHVLSDVEYFSNKVCRDNAPLKLTGESCYIAALLLYIDKMETRLSELEYKVVNLEGVVYD